MLDHKKLTQFKDLVEHAHKIVIIQADNPDGDSVSSSLALEHILGDLGKDVSMYCGVDIPSYLRYLPGWDRINKELPATFDLSIILDTSALNLLEQISKTGGLQWVKSRPCIVVDHHQTEGTIDFATLVMLDTEAVSTSHVLYKIATTHNWQINAFAAELMTISIMSDTLGLTTQAVDAEAVHTVAELVEIGANLSDIEERRRETLKKPAEILAYKGKLIDRIEYHAEGRIATVTIPWEEIEQYSERYNPSILVMDEMRLVEGVQVAIAFKVYNDGKITGKIRCNSNAPIGAELGEAFGGGGHKFASGFKISDGKPIAEVKQSVIEKASELLNARPTTHV